MISLPVVIPYLFFTIFTPGPGNFMSMYSGARYGFKGTHRYIIGSVIGFFFKGLLCAGMAFLFASLLPDAMPYLKWIGFAYLLYLAVSILNSGIKARQSQAPELTGESTIKSGLMLQCLNMKSWLSLLTLFSVYIVPNNQSLWVALLWTFISSCAMCASLILWALFGNAAKRLYTKYQLPFHIVMAGALTYCAIMAVI